MGLVERLARLLLLELPVREHLGLLQKQKFVLGCWFDQRVLLRSLDWG